MKLVIKLGEGAVEVLSRSMKPTANQWLVDLFNRADKINILDGTY